MPWERRGKGPGRYFTATRRIKGKRVRFYFGRGRKGQLAEAHEQARRLRGHREARQKKAQREEWEGALGLYREFSRLVDALAERALLAAGYHKHGGEWRKRRNNVHDEQDTRRQERGDERGATPPAPVGAGR